MPADVEVAVLVGKVRDVQVDQPGRLRQQPGDGRGLHAPTVTGHLDESPHLVSEIEAATELTAAQRKALIEIYHGFVDANSVRRKPKPKP